MQGWRISMEDAHAAILDLQAKYTGSEDKPTDPEHRLAFFGVYDGHGGDKVALFTGENLHKIVSRQDAFAKGDIEQAMKDGFLATDRAILEGLWMRCSRGIGCRIADSMQTPAMRRRCLAALPPRVLSQRRRSGLYVLTQIQTIGPKGV
jgi:serine/threonine protein phosphatase PrpC